LVDGIVAASPPLATVISNAGATMTGLQFWSFLTQNFVSAVGQDYVVEGAFSGIDALLATWNSSATVLTANQINPTSFNPGSVFVNDRTADSNALLFFMSMAAMGGVQYRYGSPYSATGRKGVNLPWKTAVTMDATGCGYASSFVNFVDSLSGLSANTTGSLKNTFTALKNQFASTLSAACDAGCKGTAVVAATLVNGVPGLAQAGHAWTPTGCAIAAGCQGCPDAIRNRSSCTYLATDASSCAAAGIVNYVNNGLSGWVDGP
jgi:hypothetical protein